jgi:CCR4-NOT transcriptional regulation complex NOT5 subunit
MEKFKACEKEMKTKAFSKEGLIQAAKLDPKEQEKEEATLWLQAQVEELQMQVEQSEAEIETLHGTGKKKNKSGSTAGRLEELETLNDRRKWHISRLEIVLRLLNNGSMPTEKVLALKDDVQYFVESNTVRCVIRVPRASNYIHECRTRVSTRTRAFMTTSTWTRRKRNSALHLKMTTLTTPTSAVKVEL